MVNKIIGFARDNYRSNAHINNPCFCSNSTYPKANNIAQSTTDHHQHHFQDDTVNYTNKSTKAVTTLFCSENNENSNNNDDRRDTVAAVPTDIQVLVPGAVQPCPIKPLSCSRREYCYFNHTRFLVTQTPTRLPPKKCSSEPAFYSAFLPPPGRTHSFDSGKISKPTIHHQRHHHNHQMLPLSIAACNHDDAFATIPANRGRNDKKKNNNHKSSYHNDSDITPFTILFPRGLKPIPRGWACR